MKNTMTATTLATPLAAETNEASWMTYQDAPAVTTDTTHYMGYKDPTATLNLHEFANYLMSTNPAMAMAMLRDWIDNHATMPSEWEGKLIEVSTFDDDGTPLFNLTATGDGMYEQTLPLA